MGSGLRGLGRRRDERGEVVRVVAVVVAERIAPRRVRADEGGVEEEGLVAVAVEPFEDGSDHECGLRQLGWEPGGRPRRTVALGAGKPFDRSVEIVRLGGHVDPPVGEPATPLAAAGLERIVDHRAEPGQDLLVGAEPGVVVGERAGVEAGVGVSEEHRVVAGPAGEPCDVGEPSVERCSVEQRAVVVQVGARIQTGARGTARSGIGPVIGEPRPLGRQPVERRRLHDRMAARRQAVAAPLVDGDEEDIAAHRLVLISSEQSRPSGLIRARSGPSSGSRTR